MALETLTGLTEIGGVPVKRVEWNQPLDNWIEINDPHNAITFRIQQGPIKEVGKNGCQVDTMILTAALIIEGLNKKFPCEENTKAITSLYDALEHLIARTQRRVEAGIEGTNKEE